MPTYKDIELWVEDSQDRKLDHHEVSIDLVDERTVTTKIELTRDERYTVHCRSPISVFCDVFATTSSRIVRRHAARFHLNKSLAISEVASASSMDHAVGEFSDHGLRTPKRAFNQALGSVEVEIRRISQIIKDEHQEECEANEGAKIDFIMIDNFGQPPWLLFRFDIGVKKSLVYHAAGHITKRYSRRKILKKRSSTPSGSSAYTQGPHYSELRHPKRYLGHNGSVQTGGIEENPMHASSDELQEEYEKAEAEEQRLLRMLQERLEAKKARNLELRRMLGETQ